MRHLNRNLVKVVELLGDGQYHDGTSIGNRLNITRAAVWKATKKLESYAVSLTSTKGKGYKLGAPLVLLNAVKLKSKLRHHSAELEVLEKTTSTNDYLKQFASKNKKIIACIAETQTHGKGRLHRKWHSPFAENIYLSVLYPFEKDISELSGLSLVVNLAVCQAIESIIDLKEKSLKVKWPNDILIDGHKLGGILIEIQAESNGFSQAIIGIGVNVNMRKAIKKDINQAWTSLCRIVDQYLDRNILCTAIIDSLINYLKRFLSGGLSVFTEEWRSRDNLLYSNIALISGDKKFYGVCMGINEQGHLLLKAEDETVSAFSSGDTSLLK